MMVGDIIPDLLQPTAWGERMPLRFVESPDRHEVVVYNLDYGGIEVARWGWARLQRAAYNRQELHEMLAACEPTSLQVLTYAQLTGPHVSEGLGRRG